MPFFAIYCTDAPDALETRLARRPEHLDYLNGTGAVRIAGALLDENDSPIGSLVVIEAASLAAAEAHAAGDPFVAAGVFAEVVVRPWRVAIGSVPGA